MELLTKSLILRYITQQDINEIARMWKCLDKITIGDAYAPCIQPNILP